MNIYQKIIKVMESVEYLKKDDTVGSGNNQYKAISDEKVKVSIRNQMIANKLVMFRVSVDTETISREYEQYNDFKKITESKIQHFCKVKSTYKIVNAENPEESIEIQSIGHGVDPQDKAAGKAMTYASKYAMLDTFIIPTGEDSDKTHSNDIEPPVNAKKKDNASKPKTTSTPAPKVEKIDDNMKASLHIRLKNKGISDEDKKKYLKMKYNIESSKDLDVNQYKEMMAYLAKKPDVKKEDKKDDK